MSRKALWFAACALAVSGCVTTDRPAYEGRPEEGRKVAEQLCASCHAIGANGASANPEAPPFRTILTRYGSDALVRDLDESLSISHLKMPTFYMSDDHPEDLVAYLKTIAPDPR